MTLQPAVRQGHLLFGILPEFSSDSLAFMLDVRRYGDLVKAYFGPFPMYFASSPELIHSILVENADKFYKSRVVKRVLEPSAGNGIFTSDGDFWRRQRKLVQPAFHTRRIGSYADVMTQYSTEMLAHWRDGEVRSIDEDMTHLTLRIIAKTLFDADVNSTLDELGVALIDIFKLSDERFNQIPSIPYWVPIKLNRSLRSSVAVVDKEINRFIDDRRRLKEDKGDLLSMLLAAQDEDGALMTDRQVRDEAMTLFGAGHETTAVTMTWALYLLSQYPDVAARLEQEVDEVLQGRPATLEDLPRLKYTEMVIKETMRLYPPAWGTSREAVADVNIGDYALKRGSLLFVNIYGMHRDDRYFPDPLKFEPERFNAEREKSIPKYAYIPFGGGPRVCIGNAFALMEARLILATLVQRYRFELEPGHVVKPKRQFTLRPAYGMRMIVHERSPQTITSGPTADAMSR